MEQVFEVDNLFINSYGNKAGSSLVWLHNIVMVTRQGKESSLVWLHTTSCGDKAREGKQSGLVTQHSYGETAGKQSGLVTHHRCDKGRKAVWLGYTTQMW